MKQVFINIALLLIVSLIPVAVKAEEPVEVLEFEPVIMVPLVLDQDGDGLSNEEEERLGTFPDNCDSDEDGLFDAIEVGIIKPADPEAENDCHGLEPAGSNYRNPNFLDPLNPDSDGDGLLDGEEDFNGNGWVDSDESDPTLEDTDRDDISDGIEAFADFDEDGIPDFDLSLITAGPECSPPDNIYDLDCDGRPNWVDVDSDADGCPDLEEGGRIDRNSNGIPDVYDNEAKQCAQASDSGGGGVSFGGSGSAPSSDEDELAGPVSTPAWLTDQTGGSACTLTSNIPSNSIGLFIIFPVFFLLFLRRTTDAVRCTTF